MEYITEEQMKDLEQDVKCLILGWLKDYEVVEDVMLSSETLETLGSPISRAYCTMNAMVVMTTMQMSKQSEDTLTQRNNAP